MRLRTQVLRAHHPGWAFSPVSDAGAARYGGRFSRKGLPALYTSISVEVALAESQQALPFKGQPVTLCTYDVDCEQVEDLTDAETRRRLGVDVEDLRGAWEAQATRGAKPASWTLADRLIADGTAGIVVPSFASAAGPGARNVVFWTWSDDLPHRVRVIDNLHRLPRDRRSWT